MSHLKKYAFTLTEMVIVVAIIGVLMLGMTVYIGGTGEKAKIIEAQGCANTLDAEIQNYVFAAITSKIIKPSGYANGVSPTRYAITMRKDGSYECLGKTNSGSSYYCDEIVLTFFTGGSSDYPYHDSGTVYKTLSSKENCNINRGTKLIFYATGDRHYRTNFVMNKGFMPLSYNEKNPFYSIGCEWGNETRQLYTEFIILACFNNDCETAKEIAKRVVDSRSQTITLKKCKFYQYDDPRLCKERED